MLDIQSSLCIWIEIPEFQIPLRVTHHKFIFLQPTAAECDTPLVIVEWNNLSDSGVVVRIRVDFVHRHFPVPLRDCTLIVEWGTPDHCCIVFQIGQRSEGMVGLTLGLILIVKDVNVWILHVIAQIVD